MTKRYQSVSAYPELKPVLDSKIDDDELTHQFSAVSKAIVNSTAEKLLDSSKKAQKQNDRNSMLMTELQKLRSEIAEMMKQRVFLFFCPEFFSFLKADFVWVVDFRTFKFATIWRDQKKGFASFTPMTLWRIPG